MASNNAAKLSGLRFGDLGELPKRMLAPIEGYEDMPIVTLEEAVKPLVDIVPKIERNVFIVKQNCQEPEDNLTTDESASIMLYTYESMPQKNSLYVILNATLRSEQRQKLTPWFLYLRLVLTALARLRSERCFVNRGVREDLRAQYPKGASFIWWGFSSCTSSIEVLENEQFFGKSGTRTLFQIDCHTGKNIKNHSFIASENEILLLPARQFTVKGWLDSGNGLHIIQLEEIDPAFPLIEPVSVPKSITKSETDSTPKPAVKATKIDLPAKFTEKMVLESKPVIQTKPSRKQEFAALGAFKEQYCKGRLCATCGKCRDWYYTGDAADLSWMRSAKNWSASDWERWDNNKTWERFKKSTDGATCTYHYHIYGGGGGHGIIIAADIAGGIIAADIYGIGADGAAIAAACLCDSNVRG